MPMFSTGRPTDTADPVATPPRPIRCCRQSRTRRRPSRAPAVTTTRSAEAGIPRTRRSRSAKATRSSARPSGSELPSRKSSSASRAADRQAARHVGDTTPEPSTREGRRLMGEVEPAPALPRLLRRAASVWSFARNSSAAAPSLSLSRDVRGACLRLCGLVGVGGCSAAAGRGTAARSGLTIVPEPSADTMHPSAVSCS